MAKKKMGGLGKGLDLLFADLPETSSDDAAASTLPLREIEPDPAQPRKQFDDDALNQLADSITENGLLQPIAVRPKKLGTGYIIIAGERRWRAAGWPSWMRCGHHQGCIGRTSRSPGADRKPAARGPESHRGSRGLPPAD